MSMVRTQNVEDSVEFKESYFDFSKGIPALVNHYKQLWWETGISFPGFSVSYSLENQRENENRIEKETTQLIKVAKHFSSNYDEFNSLQQNIRSTIINLAEDLFFIQPADFEFVEKSGLLESARKFFHMARDFDPDIPFSDIYQAGRNIITANLIQLLLGLPVETTPSLFAYSMLYPYTDNYLDDSNISLTSKKEFNQRFRERLLGKSIRPVNKHEKIVDSLIQMIEFEWDRNKFPMVYQSLLTIHSAQVKSLELVSSQISPFEKDILGITFEKGGTSVLTDGYLVAGELSIDQASALFGFGAFTQLMDDVEDISTDIQENRASLFSISAPFWKLDTICNRFLNFGRATIGNLGIFPGQFVPEVTCLINKCIDPMLLGSISLSVDYLSKSYSEALEGHMPIRFSRLKKQKEKLAKNSANLIQLVEHQLGLMV